MRMHKSLKLLLLLLLVVLIVSGCSVSNGIHFKWRGSTRAGKMEWSYSYFHGTEMKPVRLTAGENIDVKYQATIEKGTLVLSLKSPDDATVWEKSLTTSQSGETTIDVEETGTYRVIVGGEETAGSFTLTWDRH